ncbi:MAG: sigma-70 family RNA polymerase sigma factor [Ferruginibacter sp.]|nr:sigma-70 family RNA polymerase sigma factor [Ferruginibacter sp.]
MIENLPTNDSQLINKYLNGEQYAFEIIVNKYKDRIFTSIQFMVKDIYLAEDIFQETFIKIIDSIKKGGYIDSGKFLPWAISIARNLCLDYFRTVKRKTVITTINGTSIFDTLSFSEENIELQLMKTQSAEKVRILIDKLPQDLREVVILRHYANLSFKEIAQITNTTISTSIGRMRYALQNTRKLIAEKQISL